MKSRWLVNLALLLLVAGIVAFLYLRPPPADNTPKSYPVSNLKLADFSKIRVEFPAKAPVVFEKIDGYWYITEPYKARADLMSVQRILSIVAASSQNKFPANDLAHFGLDKPKLRLKLDDQEFLFGTYNPVSGEQYVAYNNAVYLLPADYSQSASIQVAELIDKNPLKPTEQAVGFDFSRLEQWEDVRLNVDLVNGTWKAVPASMKVDQDRMNEWLDETWKHGSAKSVEPYTPDRHQVYPSFEVRLKGGGKVHFDKIQEAPELLLGRPDEGMLYHFSPDIGFTMLNPPVVRPKK
ncbi:MAG TPA: DUF4340 domain-containing protein [Methylophilaceae bacterium]|nr:DUF4340 domain-containing protein [Methylophilaceae bacterium]